MVNAACREVVVPVFVFFCGAQLVVHLHHVQATALRLTVMPSFGSIACALCLPLALALRLLHQVQDLQRPRQLCLSWLRHSMRHAPLGGVGQPPQRLVRTGHSQEQQEALAPALLTQQQDSGQAQGSRQLLRSPPDCVANISATLRR